MTNSTDAANSGNLGNSGSSLTWRIRRHIRTDEHIAMLNREKLLDDGRVGKDLAVYITRDWGNVQIAWKQVKPGDVVTIAPKERVLIGSHRRRLIAQWCDVTVRTPEACILQDDPHLFTICPECIETWCWDYLIRDTSDMAGWVHGSARAYDYFGCRCDPCTIAHGKYLTGEFDRDGYKTDQMR